MKTLLEWLEDNRCNLKDGVYRVGWPGVIVHNGHDMSELECVSLTKELYLLKKQLYIFITGRWFSPFQWWNENVNRVSGRKPQ